ncbi:hypothetical protein TNCV_3996131 [Trichonephila clavipes]|nr:hypothetical protein TNCV_3996131 [Trichonephila clavipes]
MRVIGNGLRTFEGRSNDEDDTSGVKENITTALLRHWMTPELATPFSKFVHHEEELSKLTGNVIEKVVDLSLQINLKIDCVFVQELLDSLNQELTFHELIEVHDRNQGIVELVSSDLVQSEDGMTVENLIEVLSLIEKRICLRDISMLNSGNNGLRNERLHDHSLSLHTVITRFGLQFSDMRKASSGPLFRWMMPGNIQNEKLIIYPSLAGSLASSKGGCLSDV